MANILGSYNPIFFANTALILLEKSLVMAPRVYRQYEREREAYGLGDTVRIRKPGTFVAQDAPSTSQDLNTQTVTLTVSNHKEVKFELTDKEMTYTGERIVNEHIRPAVYALADKVDTDLMSLYRSVPHQVDLASTPGVTDLTNVRQRLFDNRVPIGDTANMHFAINGYRENGFLALAAFTQQQGAGDAGVNSQIRGSLGTKFGLNVAASQNILSHTKGTASTGTLAINGAAALFATTVNLDAVSVTGTLVPGDIFTIAGQTQPYTVLNTVTASSNAFTGVQISPPLQAAVADNAVVTVTLQDGPMNLAFHRNAFGLAMVPLSEMGNNRGAEMFTATAPDLSLSVRSSMWYNGDAKKMMVSLDCLYGYVCLDTNLAVRGRGVGG